MEYCYDTVEGGGAIYIGEKRSNGEFLGWMFRLGKKVVITGVVMSTVPLLVPPLVVMSAVGCALSLPFGFVFASYACTDKLMSKLLLPQEYDEDQEQYLVDAAFEYQQLEEEEEEEEEEDEEQSGSVLKDVVEMRVDATLQRSSSDKQVGGDLEEEGNTSPETHARVDQLRMNDAEESKPHTSISEVDDYNMLPMNADGYYIASQLDTEDIYHVAALELIDAIDEFSPEKEEDHKDEEYENVVVGTQNEVVDEIDNFSTGKEDDYKEEEDEKVVATQTKPVDEIDKFQTGKEDDLKEEEYESVTGTQTEVVGEIDKFSTGKEDDHKEEEDEVVMETRTEPVDEIFKFSSGEKVDHMDKENEKVMGSRTESIDEIDMLELRGEDGHKEEEYEKIVESPTESVDEIDKFSTGKEDGHKKEDENVVETRTEVVDEIDKFLTGNEVDHKEEEDEKAVETGTEPVDEIFKFPSGKTAGHMDEEDEKVVGSRTESIDMLEVGKEDGHKEEEDKKVVETQTDSVDEIDNFSTGKEDDHKEEEGENVVETRTKLDDEVDKFVTGKEVDHVEEDEKVVEAQTKLDDEVDKFATGKEVDHVEENEKVAEAQSKLVDEIDTFLTGKEDNHKEEEDEKAVETRTKSVDEIIKFPTGKEDDEKVGETQTFATVAAPPPVFPLQKDTDDKMDSSSGKNNTTSKEVIIERRRGGKRKFKASTLKVISGKSKGVSQDIEGVSILKESDQITTSAAEKKLGPAGEEAIAHKSGTLSSDHAYKEEKAGEQSITLESGDAAADDDVTKQIISLIKNHDDAYHLEMNNDNNNTTGVQLVVASSHKNIALPDVLDENDGAGAGNDPKQPKTVITTVYNDHPQQEENYKQSMTIVSGDSELKSDQEIPLIEEKDDIIISVDIAGGNSDEVGLRDGDGGGDDENIWKTMEAIRGIVGYKAPVSDSRIEELKALYLFTGIEPPASSDHSAHEFLNNLSFLMSVIGLK